MIKTCEPHEVPHWSHTGTGHQLSRPSPPQRPSRAHKVQPHLSDSRVFVIEFHYLFNYISHSLLSLSQPSLDPLLSFQFTMLVVMLPPLRLLLMFSPPNMPYLPLSVRANYPHPSKLRWSPASPIRPILSITGLVNFCSTQFLLTYGLCQTM